jgi:hypothetical protein
VLAEDKLFATLDTRTRRWQLPGWGPVLLSDTVGFIRNLPHNLVASFKATLEEARQADLLIHVADASKDKGLDGKGPGDKGLENKGPDGAGDKNKGQDKADAPKPMVVPPEAKQKQDLAFMKGDWRSRTGLVTANGEKDIRPSYTLDDKGKGKVSFTQQNGTTCEGPAEARWDSGKLVIEEKSNPKCTDGRTYARNTVNCEVDKDGVAQCKGSQPGDIPCPDEIDCG